MRASDLIKRQSLRSEHREYASESVGGEVPNP